MEFAIKIKKSLNHNAVISVNNNEKEFLLIGKGIGFSKEKDDYIELNNTIKVYPIKYSVQDEKFFELVNEIPEDLILMVEATLNKIEPMLEAKLNYSLIFILSSHIHYAVQREEKFDSMDLSYDYQLAHIYPKEYQVAKYAVDFLRNEYGLHLKDAEIVFFTFHFVNAMQGPNINNNAVKTAEILIDIIETVEKYAPAKIDKNSIHFSRFLIHIRYFLIRHEEGGKTNKELDTLSDYVTQKFPEASKVVKKISEVLINKYNIDCSYEENLYMTLHTQRLIEEDIT